MSRHKLGKGIGNGDDRFRKIFIIWGLLNLGASIKRRLFLA
jgi:hypothetical protein